MFVFSINGSPLVLKCSTVSSIIQWFLCSVLNIICFLGVIYAFSMVLKCSTVVLKCSTVSPINGSYVVFSILCFLKCYMLSEVFNRVLNQFMVLTYSTVFSTNG